MEFHSRSVSLETFGAKPFSNGNYCLNRTVNLRLSSLLFFELQAFDISVLDWLEVKIKNVMSVRYLIYVDTRVFRLRRDFRFAFFKLYRFFLLSRPKTTQHIYIYI